MKSLSPYALLGLLVLACSPLYAESEHDRNRGHEPAGAVYTMDNNSAGNNVLAFIRRSDGSLSHPSIYSTQGRGTGAGLGNQGAIQLSRDGRWLAVVNAGSDEISLFSVTRDGLRLTDKTSSGGNRPISLTLHGNLLYVLNAGGSIPGGKDSIAGFVMVGGHLYHLEDSEQLLSQENAGPAEILFTRDGNNLVVTEKATGRIDTFQMGDDGVPLDAKSFISPVPTPFGFTVGRNDRLFVTQANGGAANPGGSSLSSYTVSDEGDLTLISPSVGTTQTAACWVTLSVDERFAYTANTPNASISSFAVSPSGALTLIAGQAAAASGPTDLRPSVDGRFLYSLNTGNGSIGAFSIAKSNGRLTPIQGATGLPATVNGLAVR